MNMFALVFMVAAATAAPQFVSDDQQYFVSGDQPQVRIVSQKYEQDLVGNYEYEYVQDDGQKVQEAGYVQPGSEPGTGSIKQEGSYEFISDDGNTYRVNYVADEYGFQARGAHLPQSPAQIPEYEQLRREHPEIFWAENQSQGIIVNDQQFVQQPQFDQQQFDSQPQQFDNQKGFVQPQQFDNQQQLSEPQLVDNQQKFVQKLLI